MDDPQKFERLLGQQDPDALARAEAARYEETVLKPLREKVYKHNRGVKGTALERLCVPAEAEMCRSFLAFMAERGHRGIISLYWQTSDTYWDLMLGRYRTDYSSHVVSRGYPLGALMKDGEVLPDAVAYLCEDGRLRAGHARDSERPSSGTQEYGAPGPRNARAVSMGNMPWVLNDDATIGWAFDRIQPMRTERTWREGHWTVKPGYTEIRTSGGGGYFRDSLYPVNDSSETSYRVEIPPERVYVEAHYEQRTVPVSLEQCLLSLAEESLA
jgi:hypothetical protein